MLANAQERLFWPGIAANLRQTRAQCRACNEVAPSQPREPLAEPATPQFPFEQTVVDFCDIHGNKFLISTDWYTGWVEAALMKDPTAKKVCKTYALGSAFTELHRNKPLMEDPLSKAMNTSNFSRIGGSNNAYPQPTTLRAIAGQS